HGRSGSVRGCRAGLPPYHESVTPASRSRALRAATVAARGTEQALAVPASGKGLQRVAPLLSDEEKFDHWQSFVRAAEIGRRSRQRMPPISHQPCADGDVSSSKLGLAAQP